MEAWQELSREMVFEKYGRGVEKRRYRLSHGSEADFYVSTGKDAVLCVALTKEQKVLLVRQFRVGPEKVCLDLPGGSMHNGEEGVFAMERELLEETGYRGKVEFVRTIFPSPYGSYQEHVFVATECVRVADSTAEDNGEVLEVEEVSLEDFRKHLQSGNMTLVSAGYIGLEHLGLL